METEAIWSEILELSGSRKLLVSISGGNPAIQDFGPLISLGKSNGYRFACETQGSIAKPWFGDLDTLVLSPKPPSSGEVVDWSAFAECLEAGRGANNKNMKIVVFDENDLEWAKTASERHPDLALFLQPGNEMIDPNEPIDSNRMMAKLDWLISRTAGSGWFKPRILPQLHVMVWGNKRGV